jgi:xylose isomerase
VRFDQDWRFGSQSLKQSFFLVKFLEDVGYQGSRHFDAHAFRTEDLEGVKDFARGCMRSYLIFKEKARQWNADPEIQALIAEANAGGEALQAFEGKYTPHKAQGIKDYAFDIKGMSERGYKYERLDQLTVDLLLGVR